jgi:hypothetical protein
VYVVAVFLLHGRHLGVKNYSSIAELVIWSFVERGMCLPSQMGVRPAGKDELTTSIIAKNAGSFSGLAIFHIAIRVIGASERSVKCNNGPARLSSRGRSPRPPHCLPVSANGQSINSDCLETITAASIPHLIITEQTEAHIRI